MIIRLETAPTFESSISAHKSFGSNKHALQSFIHFDILTIEGAHFVQNVREGAGTWIVKTQKSKRVDEREMQERCAC